MTKAVSPNFSYPLQITEPPADNLKVPEDARLIRAAFLFTHRSGGTGLGSIGELFAFEDAPGEVLAEVALSVEITKTKQKKRRADSTSNARSLADSPVKTPVVSGAFVLSALPVLGDTAAVRDRAVEILFLVDPQLADALPEALPFPPEDDPFTKTLEEWEADWYAVRESAYRVYLNMRMEFRKQLARAALGEPHDLKPWSHWVFNGVRPTDGEPVYGLSDERRKELGWNYHGPAQDFQIYVSSEAVS